MWQRWNGRRIKAVTEKLKTKPRDARWLIKNFGSCSEPIKKLNKAGVDVRASRASAGDDLGKMFWWVPSNRATLKKSLRALRIKGDG